MLFSAYFLSINAEFKQIDLKRFLELKENANLIGDTKAEIYLNEEDATLPDFDNMKEYEFFMAHFMGENDIDLFYLFTKKEDAEKLLFTANIKIGLVNWYGFLNLAEKQQEARTWGDTFSDLYSRVAYYV
jgi:hypothetical protein